MGVDRRAYTSAFIHTLHGLPAAILGGRLPTILCTVLLAATMWQLAADFWGTPAGLICATLLCFDPLILAHGRLATNDMAVTAMGTLYLYLTWRWGRKPTWIKAMLLGMLLGITMLTKASGVLYAFISLPWFFWVTYSVQKKRFLGLQVIAIGFLAVLLIWLAYGMTWGPISAIPTISVPAPEHWEGTLFQVQNAPKRDVFALGIHKTGRWWWFFPVVFLLKNPLPLLLILPFAAYILIKFRTHTRPSHNTPRTAGGVLFLEFCILYTGAAIFVGPNIGYRHFLPVQPLLLVVIAGACTLVWRAIATPIRLLLVGLGVWYALGTLWIFPYEISFFNELTGGSNEGWRYLTASNTDWLQGWNALKAWQEKTGIHFHYSGPEGYLGLNDYDIVYESLPPVGGKTNQLLSPWITPLPGDYLIGSSVLSGMNILDVDNYSWFRCRQPDAVIAHSLYYYRVKPEETPTWVAQCNQPVEPLNEQALAQGYGTHSYRLISFDCTRSWIYPENGQSRGHYVFHAQLLSPETWQTRLYLSDPSPLDSFAARHLQKADMTARERRDQQFPAFGAYAWTAQSLPIPLSAALPAPAASNPQQLSGADVSSAPVTFHSTLTLLGVQSFVEQNTMDVETWWTVEQNGVTRPFSVMAHLLTSGGQMLELDDGFHISPLILEHGDVIVQRHTFSTTCYEHDNLWLRTGLYWLDSLDRWTIDGTADDAVFINLCAGEQF